MEGSLCKGTTNRELRDGEVWMPHRPTWNDGHWNFQEIRTVQKNGEKANVEHSTSNVQHRTGNGNKPQRQMNLYMEASERLDGEGSRDGREGGDDRETRTRRFEI